MKKIVVALATGLVIVSLACRPRQPSRLNHRHVGQDRKSRVSTAYDGRSPLPSIVAAQALTVKTVDNGREGRDWPSRTRRRPCWDTLRARDLVQVTYSASTTSSGPSGSSRRGGAAAQ